jgi:hypothetical protein
VRYLVHEESENGLEGLLESCEGETRKVRESRKSGTLTSTNFPFSKREAQRQAREGESGIC